MSELENSPLTIQDYKEALKPIATHEEDSYVRGITAIKYFSTEDNEKELLTSALNTKSPYTHNILSEQEAVTQRNLIEGSVIRFLCTSKEYSTITNSLHFKQLVLVPINTWSAYAGEVNDIEAEKIMKAKGELQQSVSGVLWTFHKEELKKQGFSDDSQFAHSLFPNEPNAVRPNSYNEELINDTRKELQK